MARLHVLEKAAQTFHVANIPYSIMYVTDLHILQNILTLLKFLEISKFLKTFKKFLGFYRMKNVKNHL